MSVDSPCIHICKMNVETRVCVGCYRTEEEIENWEDYSEIEKATINTGLEIRKELIDVGTNYDY